MREYETVFITQPNITDAERSRLSEMLSSVLGKHSGRLFYARDMGKRNLAYPIKKQLKGIYTCLDYAADNTAVNEIERNLKFDENVIRFLTVVKNEDVDVEARAAEVVARGEDVSESTDEIPAASPQSLKPAPDKADENGNDDVLSTDGERGEE